MLSTKARPLERRKERERERESRSSDQTEIERKGERERERVKEREKKREIDGTIHLHSVWVMLQCNVMAAVDGWCPV